MGYMNAEFLESRVKTTAWLRYMGEFLDRWHQHFLSTDCTLLCGMATYKQWCEHLQKLKNTNKGAF